MSYIHFLTTCWLNKQIDAKTAYKPYLMLIKLVNLSLIRSLVLCIKGYIFYVISLLSLSNVVWVSSLFTITFTSIWAMYFSFSWSWFFSAWTSVDELLFCLGSIALNTWDDYNDESLKHRHTIHKHIGLYPSYVHSIESPGRFQTN